MQFARVAGVLLYLNINKRYVFSTLSTRLSLRNAAFFTPAVIIKLTGGQEGGIREGGLEGVFKVGRCEGIFLCLLNYRRNI